VIVDPPDNADSWQPLPLPLVMEGVHPSTMKAFLAFQKAVNTFQQMVLKDMSEDGAQPSRMLCLRVIATYDGLCQREIAEILRISRARVTTVMQGLEKMGAIRRERDENDQRLTRVYLTELGRSLDQQKGSLRSSRINQMFGCMSEQERIQLQRCLDDVTSRLRGIIQANGPAVSADS
jgi:DNA-binding MarR family transcriptional regulator